MATVFIGGSALLLAGAAVALVFGFGGGEESLVWTSLFAAGGAAVFLVIAYIFSRRELKRAKRAASAPVASAPVQEAEPQPVEAETEKTDVAPAADATTADETPSSDPTETAEEPAEAEAAQVVGVASRKKFHRPECRYATSDGEKMSASDARKKGYSACGICKP